MSYLLEILGRGLIGHLSGAFTSVLAMRCEDATEALEQAVEDEPDDVEAQIRLASRYLEESKPVDARSIFLAILQRDGQNLAARLGLACVFDELEEMEIALEQLRIAQKHDAANPAILFCLGYCHERMNNSESAIAYYQDSLSLCPTLRNAHERLAAIYLQQLDLDLAIHHYSRLCELDPDMIDLHLTLANLLLKAGDYEGAIERYEHALALEPDNWTAHNDKVSAYEEAGLIREAIEHLHDMLDDNPDDADTRLRLGDMYARIGNDNGAIEHYGEAIRLCPEYLEANVKLGTQFLKIGRHQDAARWFSFALEINDRLLAAYVGIGVAQNAAGRRDEAVASFDMARNIEPNSTLLFSEVARMQLKAAAGEAANSYLSVSPQTQTLAEPGASVETQRADLLSQQIDRLRGAIEAQPNHADLHYRLGLLLRNRGQIEDAVIAFRSAVEINPSYMKALIKLGLSLSELDQTDEAIEVLARATELKPDYADLHYRLGLIFAQRHQFELAIEHYEQAVEGNPQNVAFQANLALALQNMGLIDRANASWQIVQSLSPDSTQAQQARSQMAKNRKEG